MSKREILDFFDRLLHMGISFGKAQLIMLGVNAVIASVGLIFAGLGGWAVPLGILIALFDLLPLLGSGLVLIPWALIAMIAGNGAMALAVALTYIAMVLARLTIDPLVTGHSIGLKPLATLAAAVVGLFLFGGAGAIIGPIIAAVAKLLYQMHNVDKNSSPKTRQ